MEFLQAFLEKLDGFRTKAAEDRLKIYIATPEQPPLVDIRANERHDPASLTKLMTAYLAFKAGRDAPKTVTISDHADQYGNKNYNALKQGDTLPWENALSAMTTASDNKAAAAIAESLGAGGTPSARHRAFVRQMNETAKTLGMENTYYVNSSGMVPNANFPNRDQTHDLPYTTAADTARLLTAIYRDFPEQAQRHFESDAVRYEKPGKFQITLRPNHRLNRADTVFYLGNKIQIGCKTGYTDRAQHNIGCMAHDADGNQIIVVSLGNKDLSSKRALEVSDGITYPKEARAPYAPQTMTKGSYVRDARVREFLAAWSSVTERMKSEVCDIGQKLSVDVLPSFSSSTTPQEVTTPSLQASFLLPPLRCPKR